MCQLEVGHLNDVGHGFADIHDTHQQQDQRHIVGKRQCRHSAAQKQRAGIAHEHLGRITVVKQEAKQSAHHRTAKHTQLRIARPDIAQDGKESRHRHRHAGAESVHTVGNIHRIHRADDHKGGKDQVHHPVHHDMGMEKRDIQVGAEHTFIAHQAQKDDCRGKLQQELLYRSQARVLMMLYFLVVVNITDHAEDKGKEIDIEMGKITLQHAAPAEDQDCYADTDNEHQAAHGRRALLAHVPGRADLLNTLSGLQAHQRRNQQLADDGCNNKADDQCQ